MPFDKKKDMLMQFLLKDENTVEKSESGAGAENGAEPGPKSEERDTN